MKKKFFGRLCLGFPLGISIGFVITIFISIGLGDGMYYPCTPQLLEKMETPLHAVILQTVLCGILGAISCAGSVVWQLDSWSILKQSGVYFAILSAAMLPMAYALYWMEHSFAGAVSYFLVFLMIFIFVWITQYIILKIRLKKVNRKLK